MKKSQAEIYRALDQKFLPAANSNTTDCWTLKLRIPALAPLATCVSTRLSNFKQILGGNLRKRLRMDKFNTPSTSKPSSKLPVRPRRPAPIPHTKMPPLHLLPAMAARKGSSASGSGGSGRKGGTSAKKAK